MITTKFELHFFLLSLLAFTITILLLSITMDTTLYAILLLKAKTGHNSNITNTRPLLYHSKLYIIKITSPTKGQEIPVGHNLTVAGISVSNSTSANCEVSVIVNGIKPYQKAVPMGHGGTHDYSTWIYRLVPTYTAIKKGQNKITAKFFCGNNPSLTHNSVNVTGVANNNPVINATNSQRAPSPYPNSKLLLISLNLAKNPISVGAKETLKTTVFDAANSNMTIPGAMVNGTVSDSKNTTRINFNGTTDNSGVFSYTWKINKDSEPGVFTVGVHATASGYQSQSIPTRATFNVNSGAAHNASNSPTHHVHRSTSVIYNNDTLSIIRIPHISYSGHRPSKTS